MVIQPGTQFGPYEIVGKLGAGGMGEVWRARDTRLERDVAIKVLPADFARNPQSLARFEREAKVISSLSHPHICVLHDIGHEQETHYLVMELIDGESLADRLKRGPLPADEVLHYGAQVAEALDRAHKQGVVHRDLKPGNVMLTKNGAKLLDFGLARPVAEATPLQGLSQTATRAEPLTTEGTIVGTFQYMAPEQLEGQEADARTDIFALGALLYEMATGRPAFHGGSKTSLIASIVSSEPPPVSSLQTMAPPALDHIIRECLRKAPDDRWQSAHDVARQLRWIDEAASQAGAPAAVVTSRRKRRNTLALAAALGWVTVAALVGWIAFGRGPAPEVTPTLRAELLPPPETDIASVVLGPVTLAPDGSRLAFIGVQDSSLALTVRDLTSGDVARLDGTEGAIFPFWSPDGRWLAFFADEKLKKVAGGGGPVQILAEAHAGRGGTWSPTGVIVFAADIHGPLRSVAEGGGTAQPVTSPADESTTHRMPHFLPDGKHFLFVERESRSQAFGDIALGSVGGGTTSVVLERGSNPQYADGYLFFVRDGNLVAQPFDAAKQAVQGSPLPIADALEYYNPRDVGNYSVSAAGMLVYRQRSIRRTQLAWFDHDGRELETVGEPDYFNSAQISPDGSQVALVREDPSGSNNDVWVMDPARGRLTRATFISTSGEILAVFSPDGSRLAVSSFVGAGWAGSALWIQNVSGGGARETLLESTSFFATDWSRDGAYLIGSVQEAETGHDVAYLALDGPPELRTFVATRFEEGGAVISPSGKWVAYMSDETGRGEIYLSDFPEAARKWQVSAAGGVVPIWSSDGSELYYVSSEGLFAVTIGDNGAIRIGTPRVIVDAEQSNLQDVLAGAPIAVDGERLLALKFASSASPPPLRLIRGWQGSSLDLRRQ